jgi:hypothetical protein
MMTGVCCAFNDLVLGESDPFGHHFQGSGRGRAEQKAAAKLCGPFCKPARLCRAGFVVLRDRDVGDRRLRQRSAAKVRAFSAKAFAEGFPPLKPGF